MRKRLEWALARPRALSIIALTVLVLLAWAWLLTGAGMGVGADPAGHGGMRMDGMADSVLPMGEKAEDGVAHAALTFAMWWVMMMAMMLPSASPMILLHARVAPRGVDAVRPANESFLLGYLLVWGAFSLAATMFQLLLGRVGLLHSGEMALSGRVYSAGVLVAAGIYQLTPLKNACLRQCRNPARFLSLHYRPGQWGALRMGILHGAYCVGCCWLLMALLFVGGVMNLGWIALLSLLAAAEKLLPWGRVVGLSVGVAFIMWGGTLLV